MTPEAVDLEDVRREIAVFLSIRVTGLHVIVLLAYTVTTLAVVAFVVGSLDAWYETARWPAGAAPVGRDRPRVATVASIAALARGVLATASVTLVMLILMSVLGSLGQLGWWLPATLAGAMARLVRDTAPSEFVPAAVVAVDRTVVALVAVIWLGARREVRAGDARRPRPVDKALSASGCGDAVGGPPNAAGAAMIHTVSAPAVSCITRGLRTGSASTRSGRARETWARVPMPGRCRRPQCRTP